MRILGQSSKLGHRTRRRLSGGPQTAEKFRLAGVTQVLARTRDKTKKAVVGYTTAFRLLVDRNVFQPNRELREPDSNRRPRGYEPRELPGCSIPHKEYRRTGLRRPGVLARKCEFIVSYFSATSFTQRGTRHARSNHLLETNFESDFGRSQRSSPPLRIVVFPQALVQTLL